MKPFPVLWIAFFLLSLVGGGSAESWVASAVRADTAFLLSLQPLPLRGGLLIYRQGPLPDGEWKLLTPDTLRSVTSYDDLLRRVGAEKVQRLIDITHAEHAFDLFRKLQSPFYGGAISLVDRATARALGRFFADPGLIPGKRYRYRILLLDRKGTPVKTQELELVVQPIPIKPPTTREVKSDPDATLRLFWEYHEWGTPETDPAVGFHVYRRAALEKGFQRITEYPILRTQSLEYRYHDTAVEPGKRYEYRVTAVNFAGEESGPSETVSGVPMDLIPPKPPVNLTARFEDDRVVLEWQHSPPPDLAGYRVYRGEYLGQPFVLLTSALLPPHPYRYEDTTGTPGTQYFYSVTAVDQSDNESHKSNPISVIFRDLQPPDPPSEVQAEYQDGKIYITWNPSTATDLLGYWIYRGERNKPLPRILKDPLDVGTTEFVDRGYGGKGFKPGGSYYIGVSAIDRTRNESEIVVIKVKVPDREPPLPVPQVDVHLLRDGTVKVVWGLSVSLDVAKYEVYRVEDDLQTLLTTLSHPYQVFHDTTVEIGKTYRYTIVALDSVQNRSLEIFSDSITVRDLIPPPVPEGVEVVIDTPGIRLRWKPVDVPDLAGYRVLRADLPNGRYVSIHEGLITKTTFQDPNGKPYHFYRVNAVDTSGNESKSKDRYQAR